MTAPSLPFENRRVVYLSSSRLISDAANSVHVMKMADAFASHGADVTLVGTSGNGSDADVFSYYGVPAGRFRLKRFGDATGFVGRVLTAAQGYAPFLRVHSLAMLMHGIGAVRKLVHATAPDAVHARNFLWALTAIPSRVPLAIEIHQMPVSLLQEMPHRLLLRRTNLVGLVFISDRLQALYTERFPEARSKRLLVSHDGANLVEEMPLAPDNARAQLGYVGHLYPGRGIEILLAVAAALPKVDLNIVGGNAESLRYWREKPGLPSNVTFHGHIPHADVPRLLAGFDIVVAPYQRKVTVAGGGGDSAEYMSPLKIFEYMAAGRPMICSDLPVLREVLTSDVNALLVAPDDVSAWVAAVDRLRTSPDLRNRLGRQARADLAQKYSWSARARSIGEFLFSSKPTDGP
jgi:glycosyltransferase involved in cell wall biosynthesis